MKASKNEELKEANYNKREEEESKNTLVPFEGIPCFVSILCDSNPEDSKAKDNNGDKIISDAKDNNKEDKKAGKENKEEEKSKNTQVLGIPCSVSILCDSNPEDSNAKDNNGDKIISDANDNNKEGKKAGKENREEEKSKNQPSELDEFDKIPIIYTERIANDSKSNEPKEDKNDNKAGEAKESKNDSKSRENKENKNDPKSCTEKFIENLFIENKIPKIIKGNKEIIPNSLSKGSEEEIRYPSLYSPDEEEMKEKHPHYVNFYRLWKKHLTYFESENDKSPLIVEDPYSDFSKLVGKLKYLKSLFRHPTITMKVTLYENQEGIKFVVKTYWEEKLSFPPETYQDIKNIEDFLSDKGKEYNLLQLSSASPYGIPLNVLHFVYLKAQQILISELLQYYGGESISIHFGKLNPKELLDFLLQLINALNYFECYNIEHNDIKHDNIVVDSILGKRVIKVIDLNIGQNQSLTTKYPHDQPIKGYSPVYVAPELFRKIKKKEKNTCDQRKCQIYSMGILMLYLMGYFPTTKEEVDNLIATFDECNKVNEQTYYLKFYEGVKKYSDEFKDPLMKNIFQIIKICISYNPDERLVANDLLTCVEDLEAKTLDQILNLYEDIKKRKVLQINNSQQNSAQNINLNTIIKQYEGKLILLTLERDELKRINEEIKLNNEKIIKEIGKQREKHREDQEKLSKERENIDSSYKLLIVEQAKLKDQIKNFESLITEKKESINEMKIKISNYEEKLGMQNQIIEDLEKEKTNKENKNTFLENANQELEGKLKSYSDKINMLLSYEKSSKENESIINQLKIRNTNYESVIYQITKKLEIENTTSNLKMIEKDQLIEKLKEEKLATDKKQQNLVEENKTIKDKMEISSGEIEKLKKENEKLIKEMNEQAIIESEKQNKLSKEIDNIKFTNASLVNDKNNLINDNENYKFKIINYEARIKEKEDSLNEMKIQISNYQEQIKSKNKTMEVLNKEKSNHEIEITILKNTKKELEEKLQTSLNEVHKLSDENNKKINEMFEQIAKYKKEVTEKNNSLKKMEAQSEIESKKLYNLKKEKSDLEEKNKYLIEGNQHLIEEGKNIFKENRELKEIVYEKERALKTSSSNIEQLAPYKTSFFENEDKLKSLKAMLKESKIEDLANSNSYPDLALSLYNKFKELQAEYSNVQTKYVKDLPFPCFKNAKYTGFIDKEDLPQGAGILIFQDPYRKFIGEFSKGVIVNELGFMINENGSYFFGKIINGKCQNITFMLPQFSKNLGKVYYFGEMTNNLREGKGQEIFPNGSHYEGEYKNDFKEGKGKYTWGEGPNKGCFFEGELKQEKKEGKGKFYVVNNLDKIEKILEGKWINDFKEGKFQVTNSKNEVSERTYLKDQII